MNQMNLSTPNNMRLHWNYFLALEKDLEAISRYIEFCPDNLNTYSIELAHLLLSAASEVDTLAKCICDILAPDAKPDNINQYRDIIKAAEESETYGFILTGEKHPKADEKHKHRLSALKVYVPRYSLEFVPWESWAKDKTPDWWYSYNKVKHERNHHFNKATLNNALHALAALLAFNYAYCRFDITKTNPQFRYEYRGKNITRHMRPESTFLRFGVGFYDDPIAELGGYISSLSKDVSRLSGELPE
jgi:hypothetical protein